MFEINRNDNGTVIISKYTGTSKDVIIPEIIDGLKVTEIESYAFCNNKITGTITSVVIKCDNKVPLTSIKIPNSIISIGEWSFGYNPLLTSIIIPNSVKIIGKNAFYGCLLKSIILPANISNIADDAFENNLTTYYESQNRKSGTYIWSNHLWTVQ